MKLFTIKLNKPRKAIDFFCTCKVEGYYKYITILPTHKHHTNRLLAKTRHIIHFLYMRVEFGYMDKKHYNKAFNLN